MNSTMEKLAENFIIAYLGHIRHKCSMLAESDWGLFPYYWYKPSKITIFVTAWKDIAISIDRFVKTKEDKITVRYVACRVEETHFPNLDYSTWPEFSIPKNAHDIVIEGGIHNVGKHPFIILSNGVDVRILQVRIEARAKGYPRERDLVWFLTNPNKKYLILDKARFEAEHDFWRYIQSLIITKLDLLLARRIEKDTLRIFQSSIERLRKEYLQLISRQDLSEQMLQNFLENHYFLLAPKGGVEKEKRKMGPYIPDFILQHQDGTSTLIEIQLNRDPIVQNNKPSSGMKEAIEQIESWFKWIDSHEHPALSTYTGLIIIGRRDSFRKHEKYIKKILSKIGYPVRLLTFDDLKDSIDYVLSQLAAMGKD